MYKRRQSVRSKYDRRPRQFDGVKVSLFSLSHDLTGAKREMLTFAHAVRYESLFLD
jgi:hypothetical protein